MTIARYFDTGVTRHSDWYQGHFVVLVARAIDSFGAEGMVKLYHGGVMANVAVQNSGLLH